MSTSDIEILIQSHVIGILPKTELDVNDDRQQTVPRMLHEIR